MASAPVQDVARGQLELGFSNQRQAGVAPISDAIDQEGQAALRQFSLERLMAYGIHHADAMELRARVNLGEPWCPTAEAIAAALTHQPQDHWFEPSVETRRVRLQRASALIRVSQLMMISDDAKREDIQARSADLFEAEGAISHDRERLVVETRGGPLAGWYFRAKSGEPIACAIVIGGIEGWAMDFSALGAALAARGIATLMLDGPGQGESRLVLKHYLTPAWADDYHDVVTMMLERHPGKALGFVGNSMGGSVALHLARADSRIAACCSNGGLKAPGHPWVDTSFYRKIAAHCGPVSHDEAGRIWQTIRPVDPSRPLACPMLIVHGGMDPLVSDEDVQALFEGAETPDKLLITFSDGDHCVYNHTADKENVIGDWLASRLSC